MKMTIEELQEEQQRNAAEAKAIYWYPGRDQRRKIIDAKDTTCQCRRVHPGINLTVEASMALVVRPRQHQGTRVDPE